MLDQVDEGSGATSATKQTAAELEEPGPAWDGFGGAGVRACCLNLLVDAFGCAGMFGI
jgi:hypothetical protein